MSVQQPDATPYRRLLDLWREMDDIGRAEQLLEWDQETMMPAGGVDGRASALSTLAGIKHDRLTAPELLDALAAVEETAEPGTVEAAQAAEGQRLVDQAVRIPKALARALAQGKSKALAAWRQAREERDYALFAPHLELLIDLKRQEAAALSPGGSPYDALLDQFEPGATEAELAPLFDQLRQRLVPLIERALASGVEVDESPALGDFPADAQRELGLLAAKRFGFDFESGRLDPAAHPFCIGIGRRDVRLTWRWQEDDFRPALFGILHEAGHGLYEQNLPAEWAGSPIGAATSLTLHESQSRLWENMVGRGRPFWRWLLPELQRTLPGTAGVTVDALYPALHTVRPTLIRVEADEATYNLHIIVRFEIERRLFAGELEVDELPAVWNDLYEEVLGIRPGHDGDGVLQDIHWSLASFGYFPTYTLGTLAAAQLYAAAEAEIDDLPGHLAAGDPGPLLGWLVDRVHRHGSRYRAAEIIERATGRPLSPQPFLDYLASVTEEVYG